MEFLIRLLLNALALIMIAYLLPGIVITNPWFSIIAAFIMVVVNVFIRPFLLLFTLPITILTLGFFIFVLNALMFWLALALTPGVEIAGFWWAFIGWIIYSIISWMLQFLFLDQEQEF
jgi:putative membrane protein